MRANHRPHPRRSRVARTGITYPVHGLTSGPEYLFRSTDEGCEGGFELLSRAEECAALVLSDEA